MLEVGTSISWQVVLRLLLVLVAAHNDTPPVLLNFLSFQLIKYFVSHWAVLPSISISKSIMWHYVFVHSCRFFQYKWIWTFVCVKKFTHITLCGKSISWQQVVLGLVVVLVAAQCDTSHSGTGDHGRGKQVIWSINPIVTPHWHQDPQGDTRLCHPCYTSHH